MHAMASLLCLPMYRTGALCVTCMWTFKKIGIMLTHVCLSFSLQCP